MFDRAEDSDDAAHDAAAEERISVPAARGSRVGRRSCSPRRAPLVLHRLSGATTFRILGSIEVWEADRRVALGGPRQVFLLAYFLLNANRAVSSDLLTDALWGSERSGTAKRLQMAVLRLRRAIGPSHGEGEPILRTVSGGYLFSVAPG